MNRISKLVAAMTCAVVPLSASAQTAPGQGQYNGAGYNHMNSGNAAGQPGQDCLDLIMAGEGAFPGNSASSPGAPFNEVNGKSHVRGLAAAELAQFSERVAVRHRVSQPGQVS